MQRERRENTLSTDRDRSRLSASAISFVAPEMNVRWSGTTWRRCQPVPNFPRLRALALFGRRPAERAECLVIAGVQKPAQFLPRAFAVRRSVRSAVVPAIQP